MSGVGPPGGPDVFARATRRLILLFTGIVVLLVVVSGVVMYVTVRTDLRDLAQRAGGGDGETEVEREIANRSLGRLRWQLLAADGVIIVAVGGLGLWYAHRTLQPIRETYAAQKRFVADASHELRTPLAIMKADFEVALRAPPGETVAGAGGGAGAVASAIDARDEEWREALESGLDEVDRMSGIVDDLLLLSRIDAHQERLRLEPVDVAALVERTVETMRRMGERKGVALAFTAPDGAVDASADGPHLERALRNLIKNALEHSNDGDAVRVDVAATGGDVVVRVADAGPGIAADALPYVFDRFYRADEARARDSGGSGLGLAIARWIVEQHRGTIVARSGDGQGTTITVTLPAA